MSMPLAQAQAMIRDCIDKMNGVAPGMVEAQINASGMTIAALEEVQGRLTRLIAGGYKLERLGSTLLLCNEALRMQQQIRQLQGDQKARLLALKAGLVEVQ